jgi:hypothetical protein
LEIVDVRKPLGLGGDLGQLLELRGAEDAPGSGDSRREVLGHE